MRLWAVLAGGMSLFAPVTLAEQPLLIMPSGNAAQPLDEIWDEDLNVIRWRYLVAALAEPASLYAADMERVFIDLQWLCDQRLGEMAEADEWMGAVITLMDRDVEFGVMDVGSVQVFEWFNFSMDGCEMEDDLHD